MSRDTAMALQGAGGTMVADYPAAHSMDTTWFAVDRDGHLGVFESGENGHVPEVASTLQGSPEKVEELVLASPECAFVNRFDRSPVTPAPADWHVPDERFSSYKGYPTGERVTELEEHVLLYLRDDTWLRSGRLGESVRHAGPWEARAVLVYQMDTAAYDLIHLDGACLGCLALDLAQGQELADLLGLFSFYDGDDRTRFYVRSESPEPRRRLHVDGLPAELRRWIGGVRYDTLSFAETHRLLPLAHHRVTALWPAYLDEASRTIRPVPGDEKRYIDVYPTMLDEARRHGWDIEPPRP
jgi:hypothetical protein